MKKMTKRVFMEYSRLIKKFDTWRKSSDNLLRKEGLFEQIELFQYLENESNLNVEEFAVELVKADKKYTRLLKRGFDNEYIQEDW